MGKRAKTHSAVAQQKHWDRLTLKHVENFSRDIIQSGANSGPHFLFMGKPSSAHLLDHGRRHLLTLMMTRVTSASLELSEPMLTGTITCANVDFSTLSL